MILSMYQAFITYVMQHRLLREDSSVLLAVSGGMDSVVMADLFRQSPWPFAIAHCNFQLRGTDADQDQRLVEETAERLGVPFFVRAFDTETEARASGESIQMAARRLRYEWMEKVRAENGYEVIATAHHLDDAIETLLINITRGTGISGLKSIPRKAGHIIRPLLFSTREEIAAYCRESGLAFREDRSNLEKKYARNKIRHQVLPALKDLNPSLPSTLARFFERMEATEDILALMIDQQKKTCTRMEGDQLLISIPALRVLPWQHFFLYEWVRDHGFSETQCKEMLSSKDMQPGKCFHSNTHEALIDREEIIVHPIRPAAAPGHVYAEIPLDGQIEDSAGRTVSCAGKTFHFHTGEMGKETDLPDGPQALMADLDKLSFPLVLRRWEAGDNLVPLGMEGTKKVSDLLTDVKMPLHKKKNVLVLVTSKNEIIWVAGVRTGDRFKITPGTKRYLRAWFNSR